MVDTHTIAQAIYQWPIAAAMRQGKALFPLVEFLHVLAISLVVGSIVAVDLRMMGIAWMKRPYSQVAAEVLPYTWFAFAFAVLTGSLLFASHAVDYLANPFFLAKMGLMGLAGANMLIFHLFTGRRVAAWNDADRTPVLAKLAGALSLSLWVGVITCGRFIGFYMARMLFG